LHDFQVPGKESRMKVKLIITRGENAGDEVTVTGPKFFIGRAQECQLRPQSELVSQHHCVIIVEEAFVAVREFGSRNGTLLNGETVRGERELKDGDRLKVANLEFEVRFGLRIGGNEEPKTQAVEEAAANTLAASSDDDLDLDKWLDETDTQALDPTRLAGDETEPTTDENTPSPEQKESQGTKQKSTEVVGVWENGHWKPTSANPPDAAADALKELFKNPGG